MKKIISLMFLMVLGTLIMAQTPIEGRWKTIDDATGQMKSIVEISIKNGKLYGTIVELKKKEDANKVCTECTDHRKGKKLIGMEIISGLAKDGNEWAGDNGILDPENGKLYDCKIWVEDGKLMVRGYIGFVYRTQTWIKA